MLSLDTAALSLIAPEHGVSAAEIAAEGEKLSGFLAHIAAQDQGFYRDEVLANEVLLQEIKTTAKSLSGKFEYIVLLGIGGSALGMIALQAAFGKFFAPSKPELFILDNIDPTLLSECRERITLKKTLFLVMSKSGGTPETLAQYFYFREELIAAKLNPKAHFIFVTDPTNGFLREEAQKNGIQSFSVPPNVGGRFSVLTPIGLLPAALLGIDITKLLSGARRMCEKFLNTGFEANLPFQFAAIQYLLSKKGKTIHVLMPYAQKLFRLADWYRQLLAESIGKEDTRKGERINCGVTPVNALGATDQHSQAQLYMAGPYDKLITFLEVENLGTDIKIPLSENPDKRLSFLKDVSFAELLVTEQQATATALTENNRPHITVKISEISEGSLGELFLFFEAATAFLGEFFEIDAFDQPGVELAKNLTKKMLLAK